MSGTNPHATLSHMIALTALRPDSTLPPLGKVEGQVVSLSPYNASSKLFTFTFSSAHPKDTGLRVQIQLKGAEWARKASQLFESKLGQTVVLSGAEGQLQRRPTPKEKEGMVSDAQRLRIVFERRIEGAWRDENGKQAGPFKFGVATKRKRSSGYAIPASSSSPSLATAQHSFPVSSDSKVVHTPSLPSASASSARSLPTPASLARIEVPRANPADPYVAASDNTANSAARHAINSDPFESQPVSRRVSLWGQTAGAAPEPAKLEKDKVEDTSAQDDEASAHEERPRKRRRERSPGLRTSWGLQTTDRSYLALDSLPAKNARDIHVIALAIVTRPPAMANGGGRDWTTSLRIFDPSLPTGGATVNYFADTEGELPRPQDGDLVVLQQLNWTKDKQWFVAYKSKGNFCILPSAKLLSPSLSSFTPPQKRAATIGDDEIGYARDLARWAEKHDLLAHAAESAGVAVAKEEESASEKSAQAARRRSTGRRCLRVEEISPGEFCDTIAEVVKFYNPYSVNPEQCLGPNDQCMLFVTDYTTNPLIADNGNVGDLTVAGQRALRIAVFGKQNEPLLAVPEEKLRGRIVRLRNIRPKVDSRDELEATMVEDSRYPENRDIVLVGKMASLPADWLQSFRARRNAYWAAPSSDRLAPIFEPNKKDLKPLNPLSEITKLDASSSPQSLNDAVALCSPGIYHFRVQVTDFNPPKLEDWVKAYCPVCDDDLPACVTSCLDHGEVAYEWFFQLALAGEGEVEEERVLLTVSGSEAFSLFPGFTAEHIAIVRAGDLSPLVTRLRGILGDLDSKKRRKQQLLEGEAGPAWDVLLEAYRDGEDVSRLYWRFAEGKVAFH